MSRAERKDDGSSGTGITRRHLLDGMALTAAGLAGAAAAPLLSGAEAAAGQVNGGTQEPLSPGSDADEFASAVPAPSSAILDVEGKFGGGWAGVEMAVAEAQASGGPSAVVLLGKAYEATSTITIDRPITVAGGGSPHGTRIWHGSGFTDYVFRVNNLKRNGQWESTVGGGPTQTYDSTVDDGGLQLRGFSIIDNDRTQGNSRGIYVLDLDDALFDDLTFGYLTGTALKLGADDADAPISGVASGRVRESDFRRIRIYRCGSGSPSGTPDIPAFVLQSGNDRGDGSNQNYFHHFRFVYNEGRMLIRGAGFDGSSLRRTIFRDVQMHALADNSNWTPSKYFPFDFCTIEGAVRETLFDGVMINGTKAGTACWVMKGHSLNAETPKRLVLRNVNVVNVAGSLVRVEEGDSVMIDGTGLGGATEGVLVVQPRSGLSRGSIHEWGINSPAGRSTVSAGTVYAYWHGQSVAP